MTSSGGDGVSGPSDAQPTYSAGKMTVHREPASLSRVTRALREVMEGR